MKGVLHLIADDIGGNLGLAWTVDAFRAMHEEIAVSLAKHAEFERRYPA